MDKTVASPQLAIADIQDGATVAIAGFGIGHRFATSLIIALRDKVTLNADAAIGKEQARVRIALADGRAHELFVEHARGSNGRPLSDAELETKFRGLADGVLLPPQVETALRICRALESITDTGELARAAAG